MGDTIRTQRIKNLARPPSFGCFDKCRMSPPGGARKLSAQMDLSDQVRQEYEKSQSLIGFIIEGETMPRVRFGDEENRMSLMSCPECNVGIGSYHMLGCTVEQCPLCEGKAYGCACSYEVRPRIT